MSSMVQRFSASLSSPVAERFAWVMMFNREMSISLRLSSSSSAFSRYCSTVSTNSPVAFMLSSLAERRCCSSLNTCCLADRLVCSMVRNTPRTATARVPRIWIPCHGMGRLLGCSSAVRRSPFSGCSLFFDMDPPRYSAQAAIIKAAHTISIHLV